MTDLTVEPRRVISTPAGPPLAAPVTTAVHTVTAVGLGAATVGLRALRDALGAGAATAPSAGLVARSARAAAGALAGAEVAAFDLAGRVEQLLDTSAVVARQVPFARDVLAGFDAALDRWGDRATLAESQRAATLDALVASLVPTVVVALVERIDLGAVLDRVDLDVLLDQIDLDAVLTRVDVQDIINRIDVDAIVTRVDVQDIVDRVDIDAIMGRVDVDALMSRVDLDALMGRVDFGPIVARVLEEVDIGGIVRDSTGSITTDARDSARIGAMRLDSFLGRVTDKVLLRGDSTPPVSVPPETGITE